EREEGRCSRCRVYAPVRTLFARTRESRFVARVPDGRRILRDSVREKTTPKGGHLARYVRCGCGTGQAPRGCSESYSGVAARHAGGRAHWVFWDMATVANTSSTIARSHI